MKGAKLLSARKAEKHEFQSMLGELRDSCHIRLTAQGGHVRATNLGPSSFPRTSLDTTVSCEGVFRGAVAARPILQ